MAQIEGLPWKRKRLERLKWKRAVMGDGEGGCTIPGYCTDMSDFFAMYMMTAYD